MAKYKKVEVIGRGADGVVYKGLDRETNQTVAIKKLHYIHCYNGVPDITIREISLLGQMDHNNIVKLLDVACDDYNKCHLIFEYLDLDLKKFMENNPLACLNKRRIKNFLHQILLGVAYCHKRGVMHRDLKPANLLLDLNASVVKIADFGLAKTFQIPIREYSPEVVTLWYRPPEILLGSRVYSTPVDVWSVGCIFAEMVMHQPLFDGHSKISHLHQIFRIMGTPDETTWPGVTSLPNYSLDFPKHNPENLKDYFPQLKPAALDLLSEMLCMDPSRRISAPCALEHAYFKEEEEEDEDDDDDDDDDDF
ncbi:hypothetical protein CsSME_00023555 [Camellia sinensis var. sinensis]